MNPVQPTRVRLGSFELDLTTGELRPIEPGVEDRKVLLPEQPFRVLQILIDRAGQIATRDEIKSRLWPNDTIVDFDHSINVAIGTLRRALGDSAGQPKYIQTLARRGYRLMVAPEWVEHAESPGEEETGEKGGPQRASTSLIGKRVSHFRVLEVIGAGGMGLVYKAEDLKLGRPVALKFLPEEMATDPVSLKRFEREAQTASSLNHANICTIFEIEEHEGQPVIVMEWLDGQTLRDCLAASEANRIPLDRLLEIALETCGGLEAAHLQGIIHRDIKPANIFLPGNGQTKILDFGLAKLLETEDLAAKETREPPSHDGDTNLTRTGAAMGTASYMSPEQVRQEKLDARTDLFSFGLVLYEMATGQHAFPSTSIAGVRDAILHQPAIPVRQLNPGVPPALEAVIARALQKDRAGRYQTAAEMRADLELVPGPARLRIHHIRKWVVLAVLMLAVAGSLMVWWRYLNRFQLSPSDTIVIADVTNQTSDAVLDDALNTALPVELAQTPFLQVLAQDKVRDAMKQMNHPENARVTPAIGREVCQKTNSNALIASSIGDAGNHYRIVLTGINCESGTPFARVQQDVTLRNEIVHALGLAGAKLRRKMGEPEASVNKYNKPLEMATSSSPEALQALAQGFSRHFSDRAGSVSRYERAIDIDPSFALAYASVGVQYVIDNNITQAVANEAKAYELRDRLTGQLRFLAETLYYDIGLGDLERSSPVYQEWVKTFPLDGMAHANFAASLEVLGQFDRAAREARDAIRLMPMLGVGSYYSLLLALTDGNRLEEAKLVFAEAVARKADTPVMHHLRHLIAFLEHDEVAMQEQLEWMRNAKDGFAAQADADVHSYYGQFREARRILRNANGTVVHFPQFRPDIMIQEVEAGETADAEQIARNSVPPQQDRMFPLLLALTCARTGNVAEAEKIVQEIDREFPHNTIVQCYLLPTIRAAVRLQERDPAGAIEILRPAEKYELANPDPFNSLYPAYLRGLAYLQMGEGRSAAAEFQKLLDHRAIMGSFVTGALAHLQLGRAQAMMGDKDAARNSYRDFLNLWKNADPDIPALTQAKAEYAGLR